jgi:hypothetical protein
MDKKLIKMDTALSRFKYEKGKQVMIPLISTVKVIDNELYVEVDEYLDPIPYPKKNLH